VTEGVSANPWLAGARQLWRLLTPAERRTALGLIALTLIGVFLEALGVGIVIPVMGLLISGDHTSRFALVNAVMKRASGLPRESVVAYGMGLLVVVFAVKAAFLGFLTWRQMRFVFGLQASLSRRLVDEYIHQPFTFHLERNSALLVRSAIIDANSLANVTQPALIAFTETMVVIGIASLVAYAEPAGTLAVMATLGTVTLVVHKLSASRLDRWGRARHAHDGKRVQYLQEALGGIKEIKLLGRGDEFVARYDRHNVGSAEASERTYTLQGIPRLVLELLVVTAAAVFFAVLSARRSPAEFLPVFALFGLAAFRLLPSVNRIVSSLQSIRYTLPVVHSLYNEVQLLQSVPRPLEPGGQLTFARSIDLEHVTFRYPTGHAPSLADVSLSVARGTSVGIVGTTGAGKTTLVDILLGLLDPDSGRVTVDGVDIRSNKRGFQSLIGYVPQTIFLTDDTLRRNVALGVPEDQIDEAAVWRAISAAQLESFVRGLPDGLDTSVGERGVRMSGGQRQRVGIARALYHDPSIIVLDEASSSLDLVTERDLMAEIAALRGSRTLIIVTHRHSTVQHCDQVFRIEHGRLIERGSAAAVLGSENRAG
jgi:ATP-binding cassette, subfamily B, bacterial PglK